MSSFVKISENIFRSRHLHFLRPQILDFGVNVSCRGYTKPFIKTRVNNDKKITNLSKSKFQPSIELKTQQQLPEATSVLKTAPCTVKVQSTSSQQSSPQPPLPPPEKSSSLKWILLLLALSAGGLGLAWNYDIFETEKSLEEDKTKKAKKKIPVTSAEIPKKVPYLLIGGGTASFSAFRAIKSHEPKAKVMVITNEIEMPYMRPPLSKEMWFSSDRSVVEKLKFKQWNGVERSLYYEPDDFYVDPTKLLESENGGVAIVRGYNIERIDVCERKAILTDGTEICYDECLIATGSSPKNLDAFQTASLKVQEKVSFFKTIHDFEKLANVIDKSRSVAIIGGGFLGSELACAIGKFGNKKLKIHQIFYEKGNMGKVLPEYLSNWATERVREEDVDVICNNQVKSAEMVGKQVKLTLIDDQTLVVDHVIVAVGSEPNTQLAKPSMLEVDSNLGGFVVNAELEARRHLYVAGDAANFYDPKLGRRRVEHHDHAVVSGRLAGENMVGLKKPYTHQSMFWSDLGPKIGFEAIGIVDSSLNTVGVFAKSSTTDTPVHSQTDRLHGEINKGTSLLETSNAEIKNVNINMNTPLKPEKNDEKQIKNDDYGKGVIFYLNKEGKIVGILLWNVFNRINIARKIITEDIKGADLNEVAKLFHIHDVQE